MGYGDRVGRGRGIPGTQPLPARRTSDSEAGPGRPCIGPGVGGHWSGCVRAQIPTHSSPLGFRGPLRWDLTSPRANAASGPIRTRLHLISIKHRQNGQVSPKYVEKAYHSPCFQNEVGKSPLEFLRFPELPAFSHKELMVPF